MANCSIRSVRWNTSTSPLKCNTNGDSEGKLVPNSIAFYIRYLDVNLLVAKGVKMIDSSNLVEEARAIRECLVYCNENIFSSVILEIDSLEILHNLEGRWDVP